MSAAVLLAGFSHMDRLSESSPSTDKTLTYMLLHVIVAQFGFKVCHQTHSNVESPKGG